MKQSRGFTVIEVIVALFILIVGAILFFTGQASVQAAARDTERKTAVNAMYYNLEEAYYPAHSYYPQTIDSKVLPAMDPSLFKDPSGVTINQHGSTLHYQGLNCNTAGQCKSYTLRANLERETDYTKDSKHS